MRLHLTATSERGKPVTKSGNDYIEIIINNEKRENKARFDITNNQDGFVIDYLDYATGEVTRLKAEPKTTRECEDCGDKQVSGKCLACWGGISE